LTGALTGCNAAWVATATNVLLPALKVAIMAIATFVTTLNGKTLTQSFVNAVNKVTTDAVATIGNVMTLVGEFATDPSPTLLGKISDLLTALVSSLSQIMTGVSISDPATVSKLTMLISLAVAAAQAVLAIIPVVQTAMPALATMSDAQKLSLSSRTDKRLKNAHQELADEYEAIRTEPTANADVNAALAALPATLTPAAA
jgi:ABC-type multidrug transport system fused ATPase/permease subunit